MTASGITQEQKFTGWIASLSNGETVHEWFTGSGQRSSWQHLIARCRKENLYVTQMRLQRGGVTITSVKNADGYFQAYADNVTMSGKKSQRQAIGFVAGNGVFVTWLDDQGHAWQDLYRLEQMHMHTTMREASLHV
jgi:hypothetical protein